jgi:hypothetical protein
MPVKIDVIAQADTSGVEDLGRTLDDVAAGGETMGSQIEDALEKSEAAARPTNTEFKALARSLDDLATASGKTKTEALDDLKRAAAEAGTELKQGTLEALERLAAQGPRDVDKVRDAVERLRREAGDEVEIEIDTEGPLTKTQDMMNEVKASVTETMGELAGSFAENGFNMEDSIDGVVEVAAEAAGALPGPWSLAGAALVTVAAGVYGEWKQRMEQIAEDASAMYEDMLESGDSFLSDQYFRNKLQAFFDPMGESYDDNMKKIDLLADLGVPTDKAARALVGYGEDADEVLSLVDEKLAGNREAIANGSRGYEGLGEAGTTALAGVESAIRDTKESTDIAKSATKGLRDSIEELPDDKKTNVDVDDNGTVSRTQGRIDNLRGRDIPVSVHVSQTSIDGIYNTIDGIRLPAIVVQARLGQAAV